MIETNVKLPKMYIGIAYIEEFLSYAAKRFLAEEMNLKIWIIMESLEY